MEEENTVGRINDQFAARAASWYARLRAPDCTSAERRDFDAWLAADARHRLAFDAASRAATCVSEALRLDPRMRALMGEVPMSVPAVPPLRQQRAWRGLGVAAALVAAIGLAVLGAPSFLGRTAAPMALVSYENAEPREKAITLADGSILHLDAGAMVTAQMQRDGRKLTLIRGRAYFEVAHDASRPFSVEAAGTRTVALGTKFEVNLQSRCVVVTLAEGSVAVTPTRSTEGWQRTLAPGQQLLLDVAHPTGQTRQVDPAQVTAWSQGRLVFDGEPLSAVLAEVNRYSSIKVVLGDDRLAATPIGGSFAAGGDAGAFVQALSAILPLRSEPSGDHEIVLFQRERPAASN